GRNLRAVLGQERRLAVGRAVAVACEILEALAHAHAHGIAHRDIKPDNVVVSPQGAVVVDLGIARAIAQSGDERVTRSGFVVGTEEYMSPEQAAGEPDIDGRTDLYSLGVVLFECLAGRPPFAAASAAAVLDMHRSQAPPDVRALRPDVPPAVAAAIRRALAKARELRWQTAGELRLAPCQPQARRLLLLDLAQAPPAAVSATAEPWRAAGYRVEYRRYYPHLARSDVARYRTVVFLLGREPEAPSDALTGGDAALLSEWVRRGGVAVLGYDADGEGRLDRSTANRWLASEGAGIAIGDEVLEDTTAPLAAMTGDRVPWAEAQPIGGGPLGAVYEAFPFDHNHALTARERTQVLARSSRRAFVRPPRGAAAPRPAAGVVAAARLGDGLVVVMSRQALGALGPPLRPSPAPALRPDAAARTRAFLVGLARWTRRPAEWAHVPAAGRRAAPADLAPVPPARDRSRDAAARLAAATGTACPVGPRSRSARPTPRPAVRERARLAGRAARRRRVQPVGGRRRPRADRLRARPPGRAGGGPSRLGGLRGPSRTHERQLDPHVDLRQRPLDGERLLARAAGRGLAERVRPGLGAVDDGPRPRLRRPHPARRRRAHPGGRAGARRGRGVRAGAGLLRRGMAARARAAGTPRAARYAAVRGPVPRAARRRPARPLLPRARRRGGRPRRRAPRPRPQGTPRPVFRLAPAATIGRLVHARTAARLRAARPAAARPHLGNAFAGDDRGVARARARRRPRRGAGS